MRWQNQSIGYETQILSTISSRAGSENWVPEVLKKTRVPKPWVWILLLPDQPKNPKITLGFKPDEPEPRKNLFYLNLISRQQIAVKSIHLCVKVMESLPLYYIHDCDLLCFLGGSLLYRCSTLCAKAGLCFKSRSLQFAALSDKPGQFPTKQNIKRTCIAEHF